VHFHAYKGKEAFRQVSCAPLHSSIDRTRVYLISYFCVSCDKIMSQPTLLKRIIGPSMLASYNDPFVRLVVKSFLNVLVQSLYGSTRDLKEMIRLGCSLWPKYVLPLHSAKLRETLESVRKMCPSVKSSGLSLKSHSKEIVSFLDVQILPQMRQCLEASIYCLCADSPLSYSRVAANNSQAELENMSYLTKCLMLAAFICQTNRADKDKQLFTIQKNGKKNNGNKRKNPGEDLAYGAAKRGASKLYRPRMFPMERMLSVFVSIVGLNKDQRSRGDRSIDYAILPANTGSADFFESMSHLRDIRVIHDKETPSEAVNLVAPKFWCSLTREEADVVAKSVSFPLEQFLI
jgi:Origin recognition complex (ORC) subunit 5 C-terminus